MAQLSGQEPCATGSDGELPRVTGLFIYPIKSCGGISVSSAAVTSTGLHWDRQWMVVDTATGRFVSQRQLPAMALVTTQLPPEALLPPGTWGEKLAPDATMAISAPGFPPLHVPLSLDWYLVQQQQQQQQQRVACVSVWEWSGAALDSGTAAADWFSSVLGRTLRLVRFSGAHAHRPTDPSFASGFATAFSDGYPMLMASQSSLSGLNARLLQPIPMNRFRPNLVVSGCMEFDEDTWRVFHVGGTGTGSSSSSSSSDGVFLGVKPCSRCKVITIDESSGVFGKEPLQTLFSFRRGKDLALPKSTQEVFFGMNVVFKPANKQEGRNDNQKAAAPEPLLYTTISIGDCVSVLERGPVAELYKKG